MGGSVYQAQQKRETAIEVKEAARFDAAQEVSAAKLYAERIRKQRRQTQAAADSALAASGINIGSGTALDINNQIAGESAMDAYLTILGGTNNAGRITQQAKINSKALNQQATGDLIGAGTTAIESYGKYASGGWKR